MSAAHTVLFVALFFSAFVSGIGTVQQAAEERSRLHTANQRVGGPERNADSRAASHALSKQGLLRQDPTKMQDFPKAPLLLREMKGELTHDERWRLQTHDDGCESEEGVPVSVNQATGCAPKRLVPGSHISEYIQDFYPAHMMRLRGGVTPEDLGLNRTYLNKLCEDADKDDSDDNATFASTALEFQGQRVIVTLQQGIECRGVLIGMDDAMNTALQGPVDRYDLETGAFIARDEDNFFIKGTNVAYVGLESERGPEEILEDAPTHTDDQAGEPGG